MRLDVIIFPADTVKYKCHDTYLCCNMRDLRNLRLPYRDTMGIYSVSARFVQSLRFISVIVKVWMDDLGWFSLQWFIIPYHDRLLK